MSFSISNSPYAPDMNEFWARSDILGGPAKSCRYFVRITPPQLLLSSVTPASTQGFFNDLSYLCEAAEYPGRSLNLNADLRYYGPNFKLPFQTAYEDIALTFLCRGESYERQLFDDWMEAINPSNTYDFNYADDYYSTIIVYDMSQNEGGDSGTYAFTLEKAYPVMINSQQVSWADDNFLRLTVNFAYTRWQRAGYEKSSNTFSLVKASGVTVTPV